MASNFHGFKIADEQTLHFWAQARNERMPIDGFPELPSINLKIYSNGNEILFDSFQSNTSKRGRFVSTAQNH